MGLAAMLDTDVTTDSSDSVTGEPITVALEDQRLHTQPGTAVVFVGGHALAGSSADACCRYLNFFTDRAAADSWATDHPQMWCSISTKRTSWASKSSGTCSAPEHALGYTVTQADGAVARGVMQGDTGAVLAELAICRCGPGSAVGQACMGIPVKHSL
ncbi:organomercurial lyase [Nocardia colli]|uniref:organomercurial lyase n=1 Tax=Nocardia colli TaxID=2545717 RepID=UPI00168D90A9|nr:organomercurial lyase [Nocardia colli]